MSGKARRRAGKGAQRAVPRRPQGRRSLLRIGLLLFGVCLAVRLLFWQATPDSSWPYTVGFKGDALVWLDYAQALRTGVPFELGLPIHPPGTGYLLSWLWDGRESGVPLLRFTWTVLGAAAVALFAVAMARSFGGAVAGIAGLAMAASTGLIVLSSSLDAETPYLVLVAGSLVLVEDLVPRPRLGPLILWAALNGLACLFRAEHVLYAALMLALLGACWWRANGRGRSALGALCVAVLAFGAPLAPWHARAWSAIARFDLDEPEAAAAQRLEALPGLTWDEAALARRNELPAFARPTSAAFVAATVVHRGGRRVRAEDFGLLDDAFGYVPRPIARFPFVSSYGPLNFVLANNAGADGGFSPALLDEPPRLLGGPARYPPGLIAGLPPPQLALVYPPHLRLFNEGYSLGGDWIARNPASCLRLAWRKLKLFWSGAALGFTGYDLPLGASGTRRAVDLAAPDESAIAVVWRLGVLAACLAGAVAGWRRLALWPWLLFLLSKLLTTVLFFGYARQGAVVVPVVALLVALAAERWALPRLPRARERGARVAVVAAVALLAIAIEGARCWQSPRLRIDGREVGAHDPFPADVHRDQKIEVE